MAAFQAGDTFLMGGLNQNFKKLHLYIVLCDAAGSPPTILAVPLNTLNMQTDTTLVLQPGDHPFIRHDTSVSFNLLVAFNVEMITRLEEMKGEHFQRHVPVTADLLKRIIKGALHSDETPTRMVRALKERLGINSADDL